jgi:hypothetical protein
VGLFLAGCGGANRAAGLPEVPWPRVHPRPEASGDGYRPPTDVSGELAGVRRRTLWTAHGPIASRVNPMNGIRRLTLHHEGSPDAPVLFTDVRSTAARLDSIPRFHLGRGWGDIGYHYIIDRAGRVWEGRPLELQGAHVKDHNEHNIGVMCLGNFNIQSPSNAQVESLARFTRALRRHHRVKVNAIRTHRELSVTSCPGDRLQPKINALRSNGAFA